MKKITLLLAAVILVACNAEKGYNIKISVEELAGKDIVLQKRDGRNMVIIDSVKLDSTGSGEMTGIADLPELMFLGEKGTGNSLPIFLDNFDYKFSGTLEEGNITANGGPHVIYKEYSKVNTKYVKKQQELVGKYYEGLDAGMPEDSLNLILDEYYEISGQQQAYDSIYMAENADIMSLYLLRSSFHSYSADELESKLNRYDESLHQTTYYTYLDDYLGRMKSVVIGNTFIDFSLPDTAGNFVSLSDFAGNGILLVDFWASWCSPCRQVNPDIVKIYNEFKDKGFDIVGVSLDNTKKKWLDAIEADNLTWNHMSDLQGWNSKGAKLYAVASIPHTVLLDEEGTIIARNLSKEELREKLTELLGS